MKADVLDRVDAPARVGPRPASTTPPPTMLATANCRSCDLDHQVVTNWQNLDTLRGEWDDLALSLQSDVYATFDWCRIWWQYYGNKRELAVHVFRQGPTLCAVVPMFLETLGAGPARIRLARLIGCDHSVTTCGLVTAPDQIPAVMNFVARECFAADCDALQLGPMSGDDSSATAVASALAQTAFSVVKAVDRHPHMLFDVPPTFDAFVEQLSTKERRNLRRDERKLDELGFVTRTSLTDASDVTRGMDQFIALHQQHWRAQGQLGHFDDWPQSRPFHHAMAQRQHAKNRLLLTEITAAESTVAMEYSYQFGTRMHWILGARVPNVSGRIGFAALMRQAIDRGATRIDALRGYYEYKRLLGASCIQQREILAARPGLLRRARPAGFSCASQLLDCVYYRMWFSRIRPRLGLPGRPLSRLWIRTRL